MNMVKCTSAYTCKSHKLPEEEPLRLWPAIRCQSGIQFIISGRDKVVPVLNWRSTTPRRRMGSGGIAPPVFPLVNGQPQAPATLPPGGKAACNHCMGGWVGSRAGFDAVEYRKVSCPCRKSNSGHPACRYDDRANPTFTIQYFLVNMKAHAYPLHQQVYQIQRCGRHMLNWCFWYLTVIHSNWLLQETVSLLRSGQSLSW
jgi:hypothetical protein